MTADSFDNLPYRPASEVASERDRRHYWACAIGLQAVDGLEVSDYLREVAESYVRGERTLEETGALVRANYRNAAAGALPDSSYIEQFFDNLVNGAAHRLNREDLVCPALFEQPELLRNVSPALALRKRRGRIR